MHQLRSNPNPPHLRRASVPIALAALAALVAVDGLAAQTGTLSGRVVDAGTNQALAGAQVYLPDQEIGGLTQASGRYILVNVPAGTHEIRVERLGYRSASRQVTVDAGANVVNFELEEEALALDEIVVTGTAGAARQREVGNSVGQIQMGQVAEPVASVETLLQGRLPGVNVNIQDATVGTGAVIRLRGNVSMTQGNQPLIYIDGVRQTSDAYPRGENQKQAGPLADINPADIERVEVIKGAAAATLYGTEAAAGVIQIFTKRGVQGDATWNYQTDQSLSWVRPYGSDERPLLEMEPWLRTAHGQKHALSVTGGTETFEYFVSGNYQDRDGVLPDDHENRYGLRTNLSLAATDAISFDLNTSFNHHPFQTSPVGNALESIFFNVYRAPNNFVSSSDPEEIDRVRGGRTAEQTNQRAILGLTTRWTPTDAANARVTFGYDRASADQEVYRPFGHVIRPDGRIDVMHWTSETLTADGVASYELGLTDDFGSTFSVGGQLVQTDESEFEARGEGLPGPGRHTVSSASERRVDHSSLRVNTGGFFVQNMLSFRDRYFLTAGLRVDGNSAFGEDFGLQPYPKVSGSYVISDEDFWRPEWGTLKLRGAFGYAGRAPGAFDAVRTWNATSFVGATAFSPRNVGNSELGPERTGELEVGFEGSFVDDRLSLDFTYYDQETTDGLFSVSQTPTLGFGGSQLENVGALKNSGIELGVNATVLERRSLTWDVGSSISTNRSEILDTGPTTSYSIVEGQPAPVVRGARVVNRDEFADPEYEFDDFLGPREPTEIVSLFTTLRLPRGLRVTARGEYQGGHWVTDFPSRLLAQRGPGAVGCDPVYRLVPWEEYEGPGDTHPNLDRVRALDRARCYRSSRNDVWDMPADFFKLREITAQMPIPFEIPNASSATMTVSFRDLWRWTHDEFISFDPEIRHARSQINSLSAFMSDQVPPPASATFSFRITF